jgi:hypothetical protein
MPMPKQCSTLFILVLILFALPFSCAQEPPVDLNNIPKRIPACLKGTEIRYEISRRINPFYLRADFDGDGRVDYVVLVNEKSSKKEGFAFCFGNDTKPQFIGAGTSVAVEGGTKVDDFELVDLWGVGTGIGKHDSLYLEHSEAGSGYFVWNGQKFVWKQMAI